MATLPLYVQPPRLAVELVKPSPRDSGCRKCSLGGRGRVTCLGADGEPGGLLVVVDGVGREEEAAHRPAAGKGGSYLRQQVGKWWPGPVVWDSAVRCPSPAKADVAASVAACRPYLAHTLAEARPTRVLAVGPQAALAILGRTPSLLDVRRGYAWLRIDRVQPVPVFLFARPGVAQSNRLLRSAWYEPDLQWSLTAQPPVSPYAWIGEVQRLESTDEARRVLTLCTAAEWTSVDAEWAGHPYNADHRLLSVSLTPCSRKSGVMGGGYLFDHQLLQDPEVRQAFGAWIADPRAKKVGSNLKADAQAFMATFGVMLRGQVGDTRFLRKLLESDAAGNLAMMAELVGLGGHKEEMAAAGARGHALVRDVYDNRGRRAKAAVEAITSLFGQTGITTAHVEKLVGGDTADAYKMALVPPALLHRYNVRDTVTTAHLHVELERRLAADDPGIGRVWRSLVLPAVEAIAQVESWGMPVDRQALAAFGKHLTGEMKQLEERFREFGPDFHPGRTADVSRVLFDQLGLKPAGLTDTGKPSTDADAMEEYAKHHAVAADLLRWRTLSKLRGTYADGKDGEGGLLAFVRDDGRIHPSINVDGARTGRTSTSQPSLQNVPRADTTEGKLLRHCFAAPEGWSFVELDHSQLEVRIAADLSGDSEMLAVFREGADFHLRAARMIAPAMWPGLDPESITADSKERTLAKGVGFAVLYDDSPHGIAYRVGISVDQATRLRDALFGRFKGLAAYVQRCIREGQATGQARTWWDGGPARRRWLTELTGPDEAEAKTARRGTWNTPIQGTGSDTLLAGLIATVRWIQSEAVPAQVCVPIHDALLSVVRDDVLDEYLYVVPRLMTNVPTKSGVPLVVDAKVGKTWGTMAKVKLR